MNESFDNSPRATILVVDDCPTNRQFLMSLLGYSGYGLREVADGVEALEIAQREPLDMVIPIS